MMSIMLAALFVAATFAAVYLFCVRPHLRISSAKPGDVDRQVAELDEAPWTIRAHDEMDRVVNPGTRVSDADREHVVERLQDEVGTGRLSVDEFSERCAAAYGARTIGDLLTLTRDLPAAGPVTHGASHDLAPVIIVVAVLVGTGLLVMVGLAAADSMGPMGAMMERLCSMGRP